MSIELECLPSKCTALGSNDHLELHVGNPAGSSETASKHREIAIPIFGAVAASKHLVKLPFLLLTGAVALFLLCSNAGRGSLF